MTTDLVLAGITEKRPCFTFCWKVFFGQSQLILNSPLFISDWGKMSRTFSLWVIWGVVDETLVENETRGLTKCAKLASWWCLVETTQTQLFFLWLTSSRSWKRIVNIWKLPFPQLWWLLQFLRWRATLWSSPAMQGQASKEIRWEKKKRQNGKRKKRKDSPIIIAPLCCASI